VSQESDPPDELGELGALGALRALRALYDRLEPEDASDLDRQDRATRASVEWMRQAYRSLAPSRARAARGPVPRSVSVWSKAAAAAFLLMGAGALALQIRSKARRPETSRTMAAGADAQGILPASFASPGDLVQGADAPAIAFLGPDRVEMRSGPVRLILLTDPSNRSMESDQGELR
jgi:hypothetical protein